MNKSTYKWALILGLLCFMAGEIYCQILPPACTPSAGIFTQKPCMGVTDVVTLDSFCSGDTYVWPVNNTAYTVPGTYTFPATDINGCEYNEVLELASNVAGCTDPTAPNYDPNAVCDDGSCMVNAIGCICGETWLDSNFNGVQDAGEQFVSAANVTLVDAQGVQIASATTNAAGSYCFTGLADGSYRVLFTPIRGAFFTQKDVGSDLTDSDADNQLGLTDVILISNGTCNTTTDAGFVFAD